MICLKKTDRQVDRQAGGQAGRWAGWQGGRGEAGRGKEGRGAGWQRDRQAGCRVKCVTQKFNNKLWAIMFLLHNSAVGHVFVLVGGI